MPDKLQQLLDLIQETHEKARERRSADAAFEARRHNTAQALVALPAFQDQLTLERLTKYSPAIRAAHRYLLDQDNVTAKEFDAAILQWKP